MKDKVIFVLIAISLFGCSGFPSAQPTPTLLPLPTITATIIPSAKASPVASTPTSNLESQYLSLLPEKPSGFEWKFVDEVRMAVLIPDGWFFKEEKRFLPVYEGFYVTKENLDETSRFSTGFTVFMFSNFENPKDADKYAIKLQITHSNLETTKKVILAQDVKTELAIIHHLQVEGEFPYETEINKHKIIHYATFAYKDRVYLWIFESPKELWEQEKSYGQILLERSTWIP